jgi:hypothetical protein
MRNDTDTPPTFARAFNRAAAAARSALTIALLAGLIAACGSIDVGVADPDFALELLVAPATSSVTLDTQELDGAVVAGTITVVMRANPRITAVAFHHGLDVATSTPAHVSTQAPYAFVLDTTTLSNGAHTITAVPTVRSGRASNAVATFTIANGSPTDAPTEPTEPPAPVDEPAPQPEPSFGWFEVPPATLYVATNGNDDNTGRTTHDPLRTIQRAANIAQPGDTIYIRAGTYPIQVQFTRSGTTNQPITWTSYPGETAILDGSNQTPATSQHRVWVSNARHNVFANLEIRNSPREGIIVQDAHDNLFTHLHIHGNHYSGILNMRSDRNTYQYITTHNNYDRYNPDGRIGDDADGISISTGDSNTLYRIIAYNNSDDGIDAWRSTNTTIDSSIAFNNGRGSHGDGNGIKAGGNNEHNNTLVRNNIAFNNKANGFDYNSGRNITFVNNTAYNNGRYDYAFGDTTTLRNNLSINGRIGAWGGTHNHNSWNLDITNPNLTSTDPTHPHFLTLTDTSPARNAGTTTQPTTSTDLGAIPYGHTITTITTHALALHLDIMAQTPH